MSRRRQSAHRRRANGPGSAQGQRPVLLAELESKRAELRALQQDRADSLQALGDAIGGAYRFAASRAGKAPQRPAWSALTAKDLPAQSGAGNAALWGYSGDGTTGPSAGGKPIPALPEEHEDRPDLQVYGASGTAIFSGIITTDEYNPDLLSPQDRSNVFDQMRRNDAQVKALLNFLSLPILRADWKIEAAAWDGMSEEDRERAIEIASFVDTCLFHDLVYETTEGHVVRQSWDDILRHILLMYPFGYSAFELVYRIEDGWTKWAKWTPLLPRTIWRWWVGADNELAGIQQWTFRRWNYQYVDIPAGKLLVFTYEKEGSNFEGISILRAAYKHWVYKQGFEKIDAISLEREAMLPPVIKLPIPFTAQDVLAAQAIVQNVRVNEYAGVVIPMDWDFGYPHTAGHNAHPTLPSIEYQDSQIAKAGLAQWLQLAGGSGSFALASVLVKITEQKLQADCKLIEGVINTAIRKLVDYNFADVAVYPTIKSGKISMADVTMIAQALQQLAQGQFIHPTPELEAALLDAFGLPLGTQTQIEGTNPTDQGNDDQAENPTTQDQNQEPQQSRAGQSTDDDNSGGSSGDQGGGDEGGGEGGGLREAPATPDRLTLATADATAPLSEDALLRETLVALRGADAVERALRFYDPSQARGPHGRWTDEGLTHEHEHEGGGVHAPHGADLLGIHARGERSGGGGSADKEATAGEARTGGYAKHPDWVKGETYFGLGTYESSLPRPKPGQAAANATMAGTTVIHGNLLGHVSNFEHAFDPIRDKAVYEALQQKWDLDHEKLTGNLRHVMDLAHNPRPVEETARLGERPDPVGTVEHGKRWYKLAETAAEEMADRFEITKEQAAGVLAAVSPGVAWDKPGARIEMPNRVFAERALEFANSSRPIQVTAQDKAEQRGLNEDQKKLLDTWIEKTKDGGLPARAIPAEVLARTRLFRELEQYDGHLVQATSDNMATAIEIARIPQPHGTHRELPAPDAIMQPMNALLDGAKRRAFYDNIMGHYEPVTIDTWAVRALAGRPFLTHHETGQPIRDLARDEASNLLNVTGTWGAGDVGSAYPALSRAYQQVAREYGIHPAQAQAIIWVWWRQKYPPKNEAS